MASETPRYEPTPRKMADIRRRGEVPRSRELSGASVLILGCLSLWFTFDQLTEALKENFSSVFQAIQNGSNSPLDVMQICVFRAASGLAPFILFVFVVSFATTFLQIGPLFSWQAVFRPPLARDSLTKLSSLFSAWQVLEFLLALLKLAVLGCIFWFTMKEGMRGVLDAMRTGLRPSMISIGKLTVVLWLRVMIALLIFAVGDFFYQRYRFRQSQKMTREELIREQRETYGDPFVRQRRERQYREVIAHSTLEETAASTFVVHGDTRVAIALRYQPDVHKGAAPEIVAKGEGGLALRMLHTAGLSAVPIVPDFRLAMVLYQLEVGREVPRDLYPEVAATLNSVRVVE